STEPTGVLSKAPGDDGGGTCLSHVPMEGLLVSEPSVVGKAGEL
ncbi:MAG: hypothetical protein JWM84_3055, partial [Nocardioides sp.]|nr:hypothetical protein [Nocardioides sp.]